MRNIIVAGQGTDVGKTVVSAILAKMLKADYWKPIQCGIGADSDAETMNRLIDPHKHQIFPPAYAFKHCLSPHHAARLENIQIDPSQIALPKTDRPLIIEMVGGLLVPLSLDFLSLDLFRQWESAWVLVSRHYIGSINHTLLTLEALKQQGISLAGIVFNGTPNPDSEAAILNYAHAPLLGRVFSETLITPQVIERYACRWRQEHPQFFQI